LGGGYKRSPIIHQSAPLNDLVAARIGLLNSIPDFVPKCWQEIRPEIRQYFIESDSDEERRYRVAGRLTAFRVMGKSIFADVKDSSGRLQIYVRKDALGDEAFRVFKRLDIGDIVVDTDDLLDLAIEFVDGDENRIGDMELVVRSW